VEMWLAQPNGREVALMRFQLISKGCLDYTARDMIVGRTVPSQSLSRRRTDEGIAPSLTVA
jgi:hypothetical protein